MTISNDQLAKMPIETLISLKNSLSLTPEQVAKVDDLIDDWMRAHCGRSSRELIEIERCER